ncbi:MAG: 6-pyruvoyl-tetrahydropterin synthase-related protein [Candidatus Levybacteria bacterium]|nr:6-pyruvoyl-tetrahydropterin synthase-related protein [Candidatus Levybacteria bacterium]
MKKLIVILILIHAIFLFPFLKPGIPLSHDGDGHVARIGAYHRAFGDGQLPPRWAGDLNYRFGTPVLIFNYQLPYYFADFFHAIGFNLTDAFKFVLGISFILSGVGFFLWLSQLVHKEAAFVGALLFGLAPYHFLNVFIRGAFGEALGLSIVPFIFWQIEKIINKNKILDVLLAGILYGLLILSHNGSAIIFSPVFLLYFLFRKKNKYQLISLFSIFFIGLLISAYFWLPAVLESRYVVGVSAFAEMYKNHFPSFLSLIYSGWGFGPDVNAKQGLSPQIGVINFVFVFIGIISLFKVKNKQIIFWLFVLAASILLTTSLSEVIWRNVSPLRLLEFPWRFTALSGLAAAVVGTHAVCLIKNRKLIYFIVAVLLMSSFFYTKTNTQNNKGDKHYYSFTGSTVYRRATSTVWSGGDPFEIPKNKIDIISGSGQINNLLIKSNLHTFTLDADSNIKILDNTFYFPGWRVEIDGKKVPIEFQDSNHRGLIAFSAPQGRSKIEVIFGETLLRSVANIISLMSLIILLIMFGYKIKAQKLLNSL